MIVANGIVCMYMHTYIGMHTHMYMCVYYIHIFNRPTKNTSQIFSLKISRFAP